MMNMFLTFPIRWIYSKTSGDTEAHAEEPEFKRNVTHENHVLPGKKND